MIGGQAPIGRGVDVRRIGLPFTRHASAEEDVVEAGVGVFGGVEMGPGDLAAAAGLADDGAGVAVGFSGTRVDEGVFAATNDRAPLVRELLLHRRGRFAVWI